MSEVLPECSGGFHDLKLEVGVVKTELKTHEKLIDKLTEGIEKIQEMNNNLVRMLALHEQKHETHDKIEEDIDDDVKDLHSRITTSNREINDRLDVLKKELRQRIDEVQRDLFHSPQKTKYQQDDECHTNKSISDKLKEIEGWKYILMTIIVIVIWVLEHINWKFLAQLFGG